MFKNYFLVAIRSFKKDKTNALISLLGLIVGLTCVILIVGYIRYETSFDTSYDNSNRIYRIISEYKKNDLGKTEDVPSAFGPTLIREVPEIRAQTNISTYQQQVLLNGRYQEIIGSCVDSSFFSIFNFKLLHGNAATVLNSLHNIVLTESCAKKLYNTTDVIGRTFMTKEDTFKISGIVQNLPQNSFLQTNFFYYKPNRFQALDVSGAYHSGNDFILLNKNVSPAEALKKIQSVCRKYKMDNYEISLQRIHDIHLHSPEIKGQSEYYNIGNFKYVYVYGCIALFILLIGSINFINLSIARSLERVKEVVVRKVFGAQKNQLMIQFIGESALYFFIAFPFALLFACVLWSGFTGLLNIHANIFYMLTPFSVLTVIGICVISTLLCSLYPAIFLSRLMPATTLKGAVQTPKVNIGLRKILIVVQFCVSVILIIITLIVHAQLIYLNDKPLGFNKDNLLRIYIPLFDQDKAPFKNKILQNNNILSASVSSMDIAHWYGSAFFIRDKKDTSHLINCATLDADFDFVKTFQIPILDGRNFSTKYSSDVNTFSSFDGDISQSVIVTEALVKTLGIENPIGTKLNNDWMKGTIVGVIGQFSGMSLKDRDPLLVIKCNPHLKNMIYCYVRINAASTKATIDYISKAFKQFYPKENFDFSFVDDRIAHLYDSETRLTKLFNIFAALAIIISCTGLFSLVSLMIRKRTKEIGIRKVLGASVKDIVMLISKDFIWLIVISFVIATPVAYIAMNKWLQGYANKTKIYWWLFAIAGVVAFIIAFISIGFRSVTAARANPVDSLRNE